MTGLLYLVFFAAYGLISTLVIYKSYGLAKTRYSKGWVGGWRLACRFAYVQPGILGLAAGVRDA